MDCKISPLFKVALYLFNGHFRFYGKNKFLVLPENYITLPDTAIDIIYIEGPIPFQSIKQHLISVIRHSKKR